MVAELGGYGCDSFVSVTALWIRQLEACLPVMKDYEEKAGQGNRLSGFYLYRRVGDLF